MNSRRNHFQTALRKIFNANLNPNRKTYLTGGFLRDQLLNRPSRDIDLIVEGNGFAAAQTLAAVLAGNLVPLDPGHDISRLVVKQEDEALDIDITGLNGRDLGAELSRRDFTVNALALPLGAFLQGGCRKEELIGPLSGLKDLQARMLRACTPNSLADDPLRALRAARLTGELDFSIASGTVKLIREMPLPVTSVARERIADELTRIFQLEQSWSIINCLDKDLDVLPQLFPEIIPMGEMEQRGHHVDNVWEHGLKTLRELESLAVPANLRETVKNYLYQKITRAGNRLGPVKLACLFHDLGKLKTRAAAPGGRYTFFEHHRVGAPLVQEMGKRIGLGVKENALLAGLVENHMHPLFLYKARPLAKKALYRLYRKLKDEFPGCLLLSLADIRSSRLASGNKEAADYYGAFIWQLLRDYVGSKNSLLNPPPLLNGHDLCRLFDLQPSPQIGYLLGVLTEAQVDGQVRTKEEAIAFLKEKIALPPFC